MVDKLQIESEFSKMKLFFLPLLLTAGSVAFNNFTGGRFHEERPYVHTVYGAFSGPRYY